MNGDFFWFVYWVGTVLMLIHLLDRLLLEYDTTRDKLILAGVSVAFSLFWPITILGLWVGKALKAGKWERDDHHSDRS